MMVLFWVITGAVYLLVVYSWKGIVLTSNKLGNRLEGAN